MPRWKDNSERGAFGAWLSEQVGERTFDWLAAEMAARGHVHGADYYRAMASGAKPPGRVIGRALREFFGAPEVERVEAGGEDRLLDALAELVAEMRLDRASRTTTPARTLAESATRYASSVDPATVRERRRYWLERATARLKMTNEEVERRMHLEKGQFGRWERGESWPRGKRLERLAETIRIPLAILEDPPATDEERLDEWLAETIAPAEPERRSA